ncbi:MAG TPA: HEAT repeat domain-containing protein [Kofleriaceae bacterium]|nr:HEAT repeat domain-containing protein [Kofleriaceae bacterium]
MWIAIACATVVGHAPRVRAEDRVAALTRMLDSPSDKTRLSAVLALAKLGDRAVEKPLVAALRDASQRVRAVAATALGRLGCQAALPALRWLAETDADPGVRQAANNATIKIGQAPRPAAVAEARRAAPLPGHAGEPHADLYLLVNSAADDSPGPADKTTRKTHAEIVRRALVDQLRNEASVTSTAGDAQRWGLDARHIDLSVTKLEVSKAGGFIEVNAELRLAISDDHGKMMSFLSGGAKVQVPDQKFDTRYLPSLRKEALENALRGMLGKLLAHLRTS